jgi:hypothetical protein
MADTATNPAKRILWVDYSSFFSRVYREELTEAGMNVESRSYLEVQASGEGVIRLLGYDAAVVWAHPSENFRAGKEIVQRLKQVHPDRKVVAVTNLAHHDSGFERMKQTVEADGYVSLIDVPAKRFPERLRELLG